MKDYFFDWLSDLFPIILLAAFGGAIRTLIGKNKNEKYKWQIAFPEILIAIFSGLLTHYILLDYGFSDNWRIASVAMSGYSARGVLNVFNVVILNKLKNL